MYKPCCLSKCKLVEVMIKMTKKNVEKNCGEDP